MLSFAGESVQIFIDFDILFLFLARSGNVFPSSFEATVKKIHRLLLHVLAHIYQCHFREVHGLKLHGHINTLTYHFMLFNHQFSLVDDKEMEVLDDLFERLQYYATHKVQFVDSAASPTCRTDDGCLTAGSSPTAGTPSGDSMQMDMPVKGILPATDENKENIATTTTGHGAYSALTLVT